MPPRPTSSPDVARPCSDLPWSTRWVKWGPPHIAAGSRRFEWPTWLVIAAVYGGFAALLAGHAAMPAWFALPAGMILFAWHASLQHECLHGHPTGKALIDDTIAFPPISLWLHYAIYKESHLLHHRDPRLTDPYDDPESFYVSTENWMRRGPVGRGLRLVLNTLAGRLVLGPAWAAIRFWIVFIDQARRGDQKALRRILVHAAAVAVILYLALSVAGVPLWLYALWAYGGVALLLLRSFAEHRAAEKPGHRTALVEADPFFALLFLNNSLHAVHHHRPGLAWYRLPAAYRESRTEYLSGNGQYLIPGYATLLRFLVRPKENPVLPDGWGSPRGMRETTGHPQSATETSPPEGVGVPETAA